MEFDQLIEYNVKNIFLQKSCRKEAQRLFPDLFFFFFFLKTLHELKASGQRLSFVFIYDLGLDILTL